MCIRDLNFEFKQLDTTEIVDSAQAATVALHKDWCDIKLANVNGPSNLSSLLSSGRAQKKKEKLERKKGTKAREAFIDYYKQGEPRKIDHQTDLMQVCQI